MLSPLLFINITEICLYCLLCKSTGHCKEVQVDYLFTANIVSAVVVLIATVFAMLVSFLIMCDHKYSFFITTNNRSSATKALVKTAHKVFFVFFILFSTESIGGHHIFVIANLCLCIYYQFLNNRQLVYADQGLHYFDYTLDTLLLNVAFNALLLAMFPMKHSQLIFTFQFIVLQTFISFFIIHRKQQTFDVKLETKFEISNKGNLIK